VSKAYEALTDLKTKLQSIAGLETRVFICYEPADLDRQVLGVAGTTIGVVYGGLRSVSEPGTAKHGTSSVGQFMVFMKHDTPPFTNADNKGPALDTLERMRQVIMYKNSPTGHKWRFVSESMATSSKEKTVWMQVYDTPIQLGPV